MSSNVVQLRDVPSVRNSVSPEEWQARVDLAAAYRLAHLYNWADAIYNHISIRVPGEPDFFLIKAHELLYDEVTASNLVKVDSRNDDVDESFHVNKPGFTLHGGSDAGAPGHQRRLPHPYSRMHRGLEPARWPVAAGPVRACSSGTMSAITTIRASPTISASAPPLPQALGDKHTLADAQPRPGHRRQVDAGCLHADARTGDRLQATASATGCWFGFCDAVESRAGSLC